MTEPGANREKNYLSSIQIETLNKSAYKLETKYLYEIEKDVYAISLKQKSLKLRGCSEINESLKSEYFKENEFKVMIGTHGHDGTLINKNLPISRFLLNKILSNKEISNEETKKNSDNKYSEKSDMSLTVHKSVSLESEKIKSHTGGNKYMKRTEYIKGQDRKKIPAISQCVQLEKNKSVVKILKFKANQNKGKKIAKAKRKRRLAQVIKLDEIININASVQEELEIPSERVKLKIEETNETVEQNSEVKAKITQNNEEIFHCNEPDEINNHKEDNECVIEEVFIQETKETSAFERKAKLSENVYGVQRNEVDEKTEICETDIQVIQNLEINEIKICESTQADENLDSNINEKVELSSAVFDIRQSNIDINEEKIIKIDEEHKISDKKSFIDKILQINSTYKKSTNQTNSDEEYSTEYFIKDNYKEKSKKERSNETEDLNNIQDVANENSDFEASHESISANTDLYTHSKNIGNITNISNEESFKNTDNSTIKDAEFKLNKSESKKIGANTTCEVNNHDEPNIKKNGPIASLVDYNQQSKRKLEFENLIKNKEKQKMLYNRVLEQIKSRENIHMPSHNKKEILKRNVFVYKKDNVMCVDISSLNTDERKEIERYYQKLLTEKVDEPEFFLKRYFKAIFGCYKRKSNRGFKPFDTFIFKVIDHISRSDQTFGSEFLKYIDQEEVNEKVKCIEKKKYYSIEETGFLTNIGVVMSYLKETMDGVIPYHYRKILLKSNIRNDEKTLNSVLRLMNFAIGTERIKLIEKIKNLIMMMKCNSEDTELANELIGVFSKVIFPLKEDKNVKNNIYVLNVINSFFKSDIRTISLCTYFDIIQS